MKRLVIMTLCVLAAAFSLTACNSGKNPEELRIVSYPIQTFIQGTPESEFLESLSKGTVVIRYVDATTSDLISMDNTDLLTVTGFSSATPGVKNIIVKYNKFDIQADYTIEIAPIQTKTFQITRNPGQLGAGDSWNEFEYFADVEAKEINIAGGQYKVTNNDGTTVNSIDMNKDNVEVISVAPYTAVEQQQEVLRAQVSLRLKGTNLVENFVVDLMPVFPVSYQLKFAFFDKTATIEDANKFNFNLFATKNSGKQYLIDNLQGAGIIVEDIDVDNKHVIIQTADEALYECDIFVLEEDIFTKTYFNNIAWASRLALDSEDADLANLAFDSLARLTANERNSYATVKDYINSIVTGSFYARTLDLLVLQDQINERIAQINNSANEATDATLIALYEDFADLYEEFDEEHRANYAAFGTVKLYEEGALSITITKILTALANTAAKAA